MTITTEPAQAERAGRRFDPAKHALWHGSAPMSHVLDVAGPDEMWVRGEGAWLIDAAGRRYLDGRSGVGNMLLGYSRADIVEAMHRQAQALPFACTMRYERPAPVTVDYAVALAAAAPGPLTRVRFTHTGSSAVEAALLMARGYQRNRGRRDRKVTVAFRGSYHGSTLMTMAAAGQPIVHRYFAPMPDGFEHLQPPRPADCAACRGEAGGREDCVDEVRAALERIGIERIAAFIVEPVRGLSGRPLPAHYVQGLRRICSENDIVLIFDEVFCSFGRMGPMFAAELFGVAPDILCTSKGMTAGYAPLGGVLATDEVYDAFNRPDAIYFAHSSSTDAHPVACAAGLAVLGAFEAEDVLEQGRAMGERLRAAIAARLDGHQAVAEVRAIGAYVAVDLLGADRRPASMAVKRHLEAACRDRGLLIDYTPETVMLVPPLTLPAADGDLLAETVCDAVERLREDDVDPSRLRPPTLRGHR